MRRADPVLDAGAPLRKETAIDDRYRVRNLEHALDVLEALAQRGHAGLSVSELARRTPDTITSATALKRQLKLTRQQGYSFDEEEDHEGVFCVGAAFYDRDKGPSGAISISGLKSGCNEAELHRLGEIVRAHAAHLSKELGANVGPLPPVR